jgi:AcrR family transcriptional regulator
VTHRTRLVKHACVIPSGYSFGMTADDSSWAAKRELILRSAAIVFTREGYARGTTKQIAELAGLSQPSIYHYVGSKQELLSEIARMVDSTFSRGFDDALAFPGSAVERLSLALRNFTRDVITYRREWTVYWDEQGSIPEDIASGIRQDKRNWVTRYQALVSDCQEVGAFPAGASTKVLTEAMLGSISTINRWYRPELNLSVDEIADTILALFGLVTVQ